MNDGNGDGDGFVTQAEFKGYVTTTNSGLERMNLALWGSEGTTGIVGTLHEMKTKGKMWDRILTVLLAVIGSVVTALIIRGI
jgi:hypothetical protein